MANGGNAGGLVIGRLDARLETVAKADDSTPRIATIRAGCGHSLCSGSESQYSDPSQYQLGLLISFAFAPGTGTVEPGGLTTWQALEIVRGCAGLNLVGADLVEVSPPYDATGNTALIAANLLFEMLCVLPGVSHAEDKTLDLRTAGFSRPSTAA